MSQPKYLWLDLETTGLDPGEHHILEFAVIVTGADLRPIEQAGGVLAFDLDDYDRAVLREGEHDHIGAFVRDMHEKNGLWDACKNGLSTPASMEAFLLGLVTDCAPWVDGKPILAGSTPHFDRGFLRAWCPELDRKLHYRHFDVSTLKMAVRDASHGFDLDFDRAKIFGSFGMEPESRHRAASDVEHSLQVARDFANIMRRA